MSWDALIAGIGSAGQGAFSVYSDAKNRQFQENQNYLNRKHDVLMMNWQNDLNIANWDANNRYNSPAMQMERFKQAGLNPNLIYGNGTATHPAQPVASPSSHSTPGIAPRINVNPFSVVQGFVDIMNKQAQTDNLREHINVLKTEAALNESRKYNTDWEREKDVALFPLAKEKGLLDIEKFKAEIQNAIDQNKFIKTETQFKLDENERAELNSAKDRALKYQQIITEKLKRELMRTEDRAQKAHILKTMAEVNSEIATYYLKLAERAKISGEVLNEDDFAKVLEKIIPGLLIPIGKGSKVTPRKSNGYPIAPGYNHSKKWYEK